MKKILFFIFLLASFSSFGQAPILLDTVGNACHIDKTGFAKDNMTYTLNGDSSINLFIISAPSYQNAHYSRFRDPDGSPFANRTALTNWLDLYFFANALADTTSSSGGDTATLESVTTGTGNNITPNAVQVSGSDNLAFSPSLVMAYASDIGTLTGIGTEFPSMALNTANGELSFATGQGSEVLVLNKIASSSDLLAEFGGRVSASAGTQPNDVAIMSQITTLGETSTTAYRGDRGVVAYDHSQLTSGTNPHNTTFANIASKPTTVSGFGITDAIVSGGQIAGGSLSLGTNDNNTVSIRVNNATRATFTGTGNIIVTGSMFSTNSIITNTNSITPTHSLTIPSVGTGIALYNTVDQTTNYERLTISKAANVFTINSEAGGTGTVRNVSINGSTFNGNGITSPKFSVSALNAAPASATDTGTTGEIRITATAIYVCIATNVWVRALITTF
jgi:hypothetical protein